MKIYYYPASTSCRPVLQFCADEGIAYEPVIVDLMKGEHCQSDYLKKCPNHMVPLLEEDDGWVLSESSAILKYLADKIGSPAYPHDLRARAQVNEMMDWFNTGFYREFGYHLIYPQLYPTHRREPESVNQATVAWGRDHAGEALGILNNVYLGKGRAYLCGDDISIADFFGAAIVTLGELIGNDLSTWPNVVAWLARIKARTSWAEVNAAHEGYAGMLKGKPFVCLPAAQ